MLPCRTNTAIFSGESIANASIVQVDVQTIDVAVDTAVGGSSALL